MREIQAIDQNTIINILQRLIGEISPYGSHSLDGIRIRNLDVAIEVADWLLDQIEHTAKFYDRPEYSIKAMGKRAHEWLEDVTESFNYKYGVRGEE